MRTLIIGGTGLISRGIVKHLLARGADVTAFNRGKRTDPPLPASVKTIVGDRDDAEALRRAASGGFDVVIDMVCFRGPQAEAAVTAFRGRCDHYIFCSTVCTYGVLSPGGVLVDEDFPQSPTTEYGRSKVDAERIFLQAGQSGAFAATVIRPSSTYGPGHPLIDTLEFDTVAWDRIEKDRPVVVAGDGLGLWVSTHRDDVGKLFAYAANNPVTFGKSYNATRPQHTTWREYYLRIGLVLNKHPRLIFLPRPMIVARDAGRFGLLKDITGFHGAYDSSRARADVPEFVCDIDLPTGAAEVFADRRRSGKWRNSDNDATYEGLIKTAGELGIEAVEA